MMRVSSRAYYGEYHGHLVPHLERVHASLRRATPGLVWLAGDSSLDSKYWISSRSRAVGGYSDVLEPREMRRDVAFSMTARLLGAADGGASAEAAGGSIGEDHPLYAYQAINCAVEESTVAPRAAGQLLPQDDFLRDNLRGDDVVVVSVGGNDIALQSSVSTKFSMAMLMHLNSEASIRSGKAWGMGHFVGLFRDQVRTYVEALVAKVKPRCVAVAMIYHPDEAVTGSWADRVLGFLGYNKNPGKLQAAIEYLFEEATSKIEIEGVRVVPVPLFRVLDGKSTADYVDRVEPSESGGAKMATLIVDLVGDDLGKEDEGSRGAE